MNLVIRNRNEKIVSVMSIIIAVLSAYSAILGFVDDGLYGGIIATGAFRPAFMGGTVAQDIITIASSIIVIVLSAIYVKKKDGRILISTIGLLSYYFYAYGTYVLLAFYTSVYFVYMIIFSLSIFGMILGVSGFAKKDINGLALPKWIRISGAFLLSVIICVFAPMWAIAMIPYIQSNTVPDYYAIYILDLCIVLPFYVITVYMLVKNHKLSYVFLGIALLKLVTLLISVALGELYVPVVHGADADIVMTAIYSVIVVISLFLFVFYCLKLKQLN